MYWFYFHTFAKLKQKQLSQCCEIHDVTELVNLCLMNESIQSHASTYVEVICGRKCCFIFNTYTLVRILFILNSKRMKCVRLRKNEHGFKWWTVKWWEVSYEIVRSARWNGEEWTTVWRMSEWFRLLQNGIKSTTDVWQERIQMLMTF